MERLKERLNEECYSYLAEEVAKANKKLSSLDTGYDVHRGVDLDDIVTRWEPDPYAKCSKGTAVVYASMVPVNGTIKEYVAVNIEGTNKVIALCGLVGALDEAESWANAERIAEDWNAREND